MNWVCHENTAANSSSALRVRQSPTAGFPPHARWTHRKTAVCHHEQLPLSATTVAPVQASVVPNQLMFCDGDLAVCHTVRICASAVKNGNAHTLCAIANFNQQHQAKPS